MILKLKKVLDFMKKRTNLAFFLPKNLHNSKKSSTFALAFEKKKKLPEIGTSRPKVEWYLKLLTN